MIRCLKSIYDKILYGSFSMFSQKFEFSAVFVPDSLYPYQYELRMGESGLKFYIKGGCFKGFISLKFILWS